MNDSVEDYEKALREIRELILVNGCQDEWLETQIKKIIQDVLPEAP